MTRVPLNTGLPNIVLEELGAGMSFDDLLDNFPTLKAEHIRAALQYAAAVVGMDQSIYD